jgi:hypothetical protein
MLSWQKNQVKWLPAEENLWFSLASQGQLGTEDTGSIQYSMWAWPDIQWAQRLFDHTRLKEYQWCICLEHPDKSEMAKHSSNLGHHVQLHNTILVSASRWVY